MRFDESSDQAEFRRSVRRFLARHAPVAAARAAADTPGGFDEALWRRICDEQGWSGLAVAEADGGVGASAVELAIVMEEAGRVLLASPLFATAALVLPALDRGARGVVRDRWLPALSSGASHGALAVLERGGRWRASDVATTARSDGGGYVLDGAKRYVISGVGAQVLLVAARDEAGDVALFVVDATSRGVSVVATPTMDTTRPMADVTLSGVHVDASARLDGDWATIAAARAFGAAMLASEQVGVAEACLDLSVEYAKVRTQFGKPIGSFQAIKHKCADMLMWVESARSAARYAAWCAAEAPEQLEEAALIAGSACGEWALRCASETIQVHGGVGFTWEHDAHLFFKRARASEALLGTPASMRDQVADMVLGPAEATKCI